MKYLQDHLSIEKSRKYERIYAELEVERDIHIHEKMKGRVDISKMEEKTSVQVSKAEVILSLLRLKGKDKINDMVLSLMARKFREELPTGQRQKMYEGMKEEFIRKVYEIFVEHTKDRAGKNLEFLCANWLLNNDESIDDINVRYTEHRIGGREIDVVGYDNPNGRNKTQLPLVIAESKDKDVKVEDVDKWINNTISVYNEYSDKIAERYGSKERINSYFFVRGNIPQGVSERFRQLKIKENGIYQKGLLSPKANLHIWEIRGNKFYQRFPKR